MRIKIPSDREAFRTLDDKLDDCTEMVINSVYYVGCFTYQCLGCCCKSLYQMWENYDPYELKAMARETEKLDQMEKGKSGFSKDVVIHVDQISDSDEESVLIKIEDYENEDEIILLEKKQNYNN